MFFVNMFLIVYDYGSVMYYGVRYFSKNRKLIIVFKKSGVGVKFYEVWGLLIKLWKKKLIKIENK